MKRRKIDHKEISLAALGGWTSALKVGFYNATVRVRCTHHGKAVCHLVALDDLDSVPEKIKQGLKNTKSLSVGNIRENAIAVKDLFDRGVDCIFLTYHGKPRAVFLPTNFDQYWSKESKAEKVEVAT